MNETQQIKIMRSIFSAMMVGGHLNNQMQCHSFLVTR